MPQIVADSQEVESIADVASGPTTVLHPPQRLAELGRPPGATFFCEYSHFLSPVQDGNTEVLPGVNIAYRRTVFNDIEERTLISGFWETTLHPVLLRRGHTFYSCNAIRVYHCKKFSLKLFITQRFVYSRYYAGLRFGQNQLASRLLAACVSPLLPALVLCRMVGCIRAKRRLYYEFIRATPYLLLFTLVWALGELWGYLFGAGSALVAVE